MRYLLTRLYDYSNTPKTALIQIKDPNEYYQKLITHNSLLSYNDYFMYEIAICINALCFDNKKSKFKINKQKIKDLIKGYESIKKISLKEKKSLNILCRGAAMRYLLTRLYDYSNTPKTALIQIKDPNEYYQKLIIHNKLRSYKDYLN